MEEFSVVLDSLLTMLPVEAQHSLESALGYVDDDTFEHHRNMIMLVTLRLASHNTNLRLPKNLQTVDRLCLIRHLKAHMGE